MEYKGEKKGMLQSCREGLCIQVHIVMLIWLPSLMDAPEAGWEMHKWDDDVHFIWGC